ncbi:hypothetical protein M501DRAFT_989244 [Patellaria atrata CBS 101060]|uniref:Uncharacterized protein n=1 Tax=Patellaria atrata CBS 101060 TaxID=1346257 RepID=A0A9P4S3Y5_9PEZI|nr:hypothetical protein M501DRAFT_989244 [Patellaria atrata CBS 101060]
MQCCADILSSCLQLETLDILASNDKDAIDENFDKAAIKFEPGSKIPRLRALSLPRSSAISWWDLDQWASLGGWSDLKSLQLQTLDHIKFFAGQTPKLESFILVFKSSSNELQKYETHLLQLGPLRELQIVGPNLQVPIKILSAYSVTLETLDLGSLEPDFPCLDTSYSVLYQLVEPSPTLEILLRFEKLRLLKLSCFIHEFGFDLNRNSIDAAAADEIEKILLNYVLNTKGFSSRTVQITTRTYLYSPGFQGPLEHRNANNVHTFELMYRLEPSSRTIHRYSKIDSLIPSDEIPWGGICSRWTLFSYVRRRLKEFGSSIPHLRQVALRLDPDWAKSELGSFGIERHISRSEQEWGENSIDRMTTHLKNINKNRLIDWKDHREYILRTLFCPSMERRYTDIETLYEQWWVGLDQNGKKKSLTPTLVEG